MTNFNDTVVALNFLRENIHLSATVSRGTWYYPPIILDLNGRLWGNHKDHMDRVLENRTLLRLYYRSLQPDVPVPPLLGVTGHLAAIEAFAATLTSFYQPLLAAVNIPSDLVGQTAILLAETNALYNVVLAMRPW